MAKDVRPKPVAREEAPLAPVFVRSIPISDLNRDDVEIVAPIQVEIEHYPDEVISKIPELDLWASETTESEALLAIKESVYELWEELHEEDDASLGELPQMWKRILQSVEKARSECGLQPVFTGDSGGLARYTG